MHASRQFDDPKNESLFLSYQSIADTVEERCRILTDTRLRVKVRVLVDEDQVPAMMAEVAGTGWRGLPVETEDELWAQLRTYVMNALAVWEK